MGPLWSGTDHPVGRAEACKVKICVPHRRKSGLSPSLPDCRSMANVWSWYELLNQQ